MLMPLPQVQLMDLHSFSPQGAGGNDGADIGLEQIRAHAGDVTNIVANTVRNDRRVARIVLWDPCLHLDREFPLSQPLGKSH